MDSRFRESHTIVRVHASQLTKDRSGFAPIQHASPKPDRSPPQTLRANPANGTNFASSQRVATAVSDEETGKLDCFTHPPIAKIVVEGR
jgi:hypothetical protein